MVVCGEAMRVQTAEFAGLCRRPFSNWPSPIVGALSPTVTVCQDLPRIVSFSLGARQLTYRREGMVRSFFCSMSFLGNTLCRIGVSGWTGMRSVASNLSSENEGDGLRATFTACQVNNNAVQRDSFDVRASAIRGNEHRRGKPAVLGFGRVGDGRRTAANGAELWSKDDSFPTEAAGTATFGDRRRQILKLEIGFRDGVLPGRMLSALLEKTTEVISGNRFMAEFVGLQSAGPMSAYRCDGRVPGGKVSIDTTKNDKCRNRNSTAVLGGMIPADALIRGASWPSGNPWLQFEQTIVSGIYSQQLRSSGPSGK